MKFSIEAFNRSNLLQTESDYNYNHLVGFIIAVISDWEGAFQLDDPMWFLQCGFFNVISCNLFQFVAIANCLTAYLLTSLGSLINFARVNFGVWFP